VQNRQAKESRAGADAGTSEEPQRFASEAERKSEATCITM
jgi:hypothetical protein